MNHLCATLLLFCSSFNMSFDDDRNDFVEMIGRCAVEYNAYYTENQNRIPIHLVVAVASHESGWGTSRFALEGNNYFGIKSLSDDPDEYMIPKENKEVKIQKYLVPCESVYDFMDLISMSKKMVRNFFLIHCLPYSDMSKTTLMAPDFLSPATLKASSDASRGNL